MGASFMRNAETKAGHADHAFETFLKPEGIKQLLCGVNHPQTNGKKVEKWFDFYEHHRGRYKSMAELLDWYNNRMHGSLNIRYAENPIKLLSESCRRSVGCGRRTDW